MVTKINSYYLISILPTYHLSRDQKTYLSREPWKMPPVHPTSTENLLSNNNYNRLRLKDDDHLGI